MEAAIHVWQIREESLRREVLLRTKTATSYLIPDEVRIVKNSRSFFLFKFAYACSKLRELNGLLQNLFTQDNSWGPEEVELSRQVGEHLAEILENYGLVHHFRLSLAAHSASYWRMIWTPEHRPHSFKLRLSPLGGLMVVLLNCSTIMYDLPHVRMNGVRRHMTSGGEVCFLHISKDFKNN